MSICYFQKIIEDLNEHGPAVEKLKKNASSLVAKSESGPFKAMESRVTDIYTVWLELTKEARERLETLQQWLRLIDDYENNVDDLNAWIDNIEKSADLLGFQDKKNDLIAELEEIKVSWMSCGIIWNVYLGHVDFDLKMQDHAVFTVSFCI